MGEVKIQELTPAMLDEWIRKLLQAGLAKSTLTVIRAFLHTALDYAVHPAQLISYNPVTRIKIPKNAPSNIVKRTVITYEQFNSLLEKCPFGTPYYVPLLLLYHTGMRLGEMLGLSWSDIDFAAKRINLRQQMVYIAKHGYFFTTLKTKSSNRYIIVGAVLLGELKRWQNQQVENEKHFGDSYIHIYRESDGHIERRSKSLPAPVGKKISLVCTREDGQLVLHVNLTRTLRNERLNAHSFRHTHATQLIESGAKPKQIGALGRYHNSKSLHIQHG